MPNSENKGLCKSNDELDFIKNDSLSSNGIYSIEMLTSLTKEELKRLNGMTFKLKNEIIEKVHSLGFKFADEIETPVSIEQKPIIVLKLEKRVFYALIRNRIKIIADLTNLSTDELTTINRIADKTASEIIEKVHSLGLKFADERENIEVLENRQQNVVNKADSISEQKMKYEEVRARLVQTTEEIARLVAEQKRLIEWLENYEPSNERNDINARQIK